MYDHPANEFVMKFLGPATGSAAVGQAPRSGHPPQPGGRRPTGHVAARRPPRVRGPGGPEDGRDGSSTWVQLSRGASGELDLNPGEQVGISPTRRASAGVPRRPITTSVADDTFLGDAVESAGGYASLAAGVGGDEPDLT